MIKKILFISEGERPEKQIINNLTKYFLTDNIIVQCAFCSNIYQLYKEINEDEYLDTFMLLKEMPINKEILSAYDRDDFTQTFMFFDYDGHDTSADDDKVKRLLTLFNDETLYGKLYLSYPMVEALKHFSSAESFDFQKTIVEAKKNIKYKQLVGNEASNELKQIKKYTREIWISLIKIHLCKMNFIVNEEYSLPTNECTQIFIFKNQLEKYISKNSTVAVLSSFPVFIYDYYGNSFISKLVE